MEAREAECKSVTLSIMLMILILLMILCGAMIAGIRSKIMSMSRNGKTTPRPLPLRRGSYTCICKNQSTNLGRPTLSGVVGL